MMIMDESIYSRFQTREEREENDMWAIHIGGEAV